MAGELPAGPVVGPGELPGAVYAGSELTDDQAGLLRLYYDHLLATVVPKQGLRPSCLIASIAGAWTLTGQYAYGARAP